MIRSKRGLLLTAVLTVVVGLTILFPARIAYRWLSPDELAVSGITGTVWRGNARAAAANGVYLADVSWKFVPWRIFTGKLAYKIDASPVSGFVEGVAGFGVGGSIVVSDLAASLPLPMFADVLNIRGLAGVASLQFAKLKLRDGIPVAADGNLQVDNLVVPALSRESIGGYRAEFSTQRDGIAASVEDTDGVVDLAGSLKLSNDRSYTFLGQVIAKPETPATLQRQMQFLGSADARGQRELRLEGSL